MPQDAERLSIEGKKAIRTGHTGSDGTSDESDVKEDQKHNPLWHSVLAGGIGGVIGDTSMHSLDTVKTRQQGAPNVAKYRDMLRAYRALFLEEGLFRGLYSGYCAAMLGSFPSAAIFFGTYEYTKRTLIDGWNMPETGSHLFAGFLGDLVSSVVYVPSEVLKTRLQLQGRYQNPHFQSGYNYKDLRSAISMIIKQEGIRALFYGYKATLARDLPFSALQLAFYEKFRRWAFYWEGKNITSREELSLQNEIVTGAAAGGLAGIITTPLDVIKTRVQTQQHLPDSISIGNPQKRPSALTNSLLGSLRTIYLSEGFLGFFSGVGPRFVWTSVQSSIMLLLYQVTLNQLYQNKNDTKLEMS